MDGQRDVAHDVFVAGLPLYKSGACVLSTFFVFSILEQTKDEEVPSRFPPLGGGVFPGFWIFPRSNDTGTRDLVKVSLAGLGFLAPI
jgi:hypothetical protein